MDRTISSNGRWLWLGLLAGFAVFALSNGKLLLASGFLLLGVFAFFNDPLAPAPGRISTAGTLVKLSWGCGALGIMAVLVAAVRTWL